MKSWINRLILTASILSASYLVLNIKHVSAQSSIRGKAALHGYAAFPAIGCNQFVTICQGTPVTLTSANIINGDTVTLIPAQGANTYIQLVAVTAQYKAGSFPFGISYSLNTFFTGGGIGGVSCFAFTIPTQLTASGTMGGACDATNNLSAGNLPLLINNQGSVAPGGALTSATVTAGNAGLLYTVNDTGTVNGCGDTTATYTVLATGAGGAVQTVSVSGGTGYTTQSACGTNPTTGTGNGALQLDVVAANGNGSIIFTPIYTVVTVQ